MNFSDNLIPYTVAGGVSAAAVLLLFIIAIIIAFGIYRKLDLLNKIFE